VRLVGEAEVRGYGGEGLIAQLQGPPGGVGAQLGREAARRGAEGPAEAARHMLGRQVMKPGPGAQAEARIGPTASS
jgi:hypothetical protein